MTEAGEQTAQTTQKPQGKGDHPADERGDRPFEPRPKNVLKLQIRGLQYDTTKDDLQDLCRRFGQITLCEVKGTQGFVTFFKPDEAQLAIHKLDGTQYKGYTLKVAYAKEPFPQTTKKPETVVETKPEAAEPEKPKGSFAQQQKVVKPKQPAPVSKPKTELKEESKQEAKPQDLELPQQQQQQQQGKGKGKKGNAKAQNQAPNQAKEIRTYRVTVEKTTTTGADTKQEEGFTFSISHQQYLDYVIPLLRSIQAQKEKEKGPENK